MPCRGQGARGKRQGVLARGRVCVWLGRRPRVGVGSPWGSRPLGCVVTRHTPPLGCTPRAGWLSPRTGTERSLYVPRVLFPISSRNRKSQHCASFLRSRSLKRKRCRRHRVPPAETPRPGVGPRKPGARGSVPGSPEGRPGRGTRRQGHVWEGPGRRVPVCHTRGRVNTPAARWRVLTFIPGGPLLPG